MNEKRKFLDILQEKMMTATGIIQSNMYVSAVTHGMVSAMGVLIGGSVINLLVNLPIPGWVELLTNLGIYGVLSECVRIFQLTAPIMCFNIGYALAKSKGVDRLQAGIISLMCFFLTIPMLNPETDAFSLDMLNAQNVFTAMITGLTATTMFAGVINKGIILKLPDSVPEYVSKSLGAIPPSLLTVLPFIVIRGVFASTSFDSFPNFVSSLITVPLSGLGNTLGGYAVFLFLASLLWWLGIHNMPIMVTAYIVTLPALTENINAVMMGLPAPNMLSWAAFKIPGQMMGGGGCLIGLAIDMLLLCKSSRYKAQAKLQFIPAIFNITEPANFGIPIVLNPMLLIPFIAVPQVINLLMYFGLKMGLMGTPVVSLTNYLPAPITGFVYGGGIGLGIFFLVAILVGCVMWLPFALMLDRQALKEETAMAEAK